MKPSCRNRHKEKIMMRKCQDCGATRSLNSDGLCHQCEQIRRETPSRSIPVFYCEHCGAWDTVLEDIPHRDCAGDGSLVAHPAARVVQRSIMVIRVGVWS